MPVQVGEGGVLEPMWAPALDAAVTWTALRAVLHPSRHPP
jgi:hypothetical protein